MKVEILGTVKYRGLGVRSHCECGFHAARREAGRELQVEHTAVAALGELITELEPVSLDRDRQPDRRASAPGQQGDARVVVYTHKDPAYLLRASSR